MQLLEGISKFLERLFENYLAKDVEFFGHFETIAEGC